MPNYLIKRLQRVQNCAARYVLGRYANAVNVVNLNWLSILDINTRLSIHQQTKISRIKQ